MFKFKFKFKNERSLFYSLMQFILIIIIKYYAYTNVHLEKSNEIYSADDNR